MIITTPHSLTVAVSLSMPGEYTRLRTAPTAPDITVWSASLSAIVVSTLPLLTPTSTPLDVTIPTQALQAALKALRGDDVTLSHTATTLKLITPHSNAEISVVGSVVNYIPVASLYPFDVFIVNCGDDGIDRIRELARLSQQSPHSPDCRSRAFILDEVHALPDKAVQALLHPLENDKTNLWIAITSRSPSQLDAALRSRFAYHLALGAADVATVLQSEGRDAKEAASIAQRAQGDLRLALIGGLDGAVAIAPEIRIQHTPQGLRLDCNPRSLLVAALRNPFAVQAQLLNESFDCPSVHAMLCGTFSQRNEIAAHQLVAACRKAGLWEG